jgi:SpoVK/Ycf46/Vps4 family AAA+-type ATPase
MSEEEPRADQKIGPPGPDKRFEHDGSTVEIYNLEDIFIGSKAKIYDRSDFGGVIERAVIDKTPLVYTDTNEHCLDLTLTINLDPFRGDSQYISSSYDPMNERVKIGGSHFDARDTIYNNLKYIVTKGGMRLLAWHDTKSNKVILSNNLRIHDTSAPDDQGRQVNVNPARLDSLDGAVQIEEFSRAVVSLIDSIQNSHLKRTYRIGEKIIEEQQVKDVGKRIIEKAASSEGRSTEQPPASGTPMELFSDILQTVEDKVSLSDVGGLEDVKQDLQDIALSFSKSEIMAKWGAKRPQGILLYGPPGTGKTMLVEALANEIDADMMAIQSSDIYKKWLGDSEEKVKELFTELRKIDKPTVVLFDEFDAVVGITDEPTGADNARNSVAGIFKQEMNTLARDNPNVLVVATTNHLEKVDPSLVRTGRFDHKIYIPMPDDHGRDQIISGIISRLMLSKESGEFKIFADGINVHELVDLTDDLSGADISEIFRRLSLVKAMEEARTGTAGPITNSEIAETIREFKSERFA